jgi:ABC-2 type transport system ATP-binding protein
VCAGFFRAPGSSAADLLLDEASRRLTIVARDGLGTLLTVARALRAGRVGVADISLRQPSLDEAFLTLTSGPQEARA